MGSSNITCSISKLPITSGTPVRVFILASTSESYPFYSTSLFTPITTGLREKYQDYARVGDTTQDALFNVGKNHYLIGDISDISDFKKTVELKGYECTAHISFVREDVYQAALRVTDMNDISRDDLKLELAARKKIRDDLAQQMKDVPNGDALANALVSSRLYLFNAQEMPFKKQLGIVYQEAEGDAFPHALAPYKAKMEEMLYSKPVTDDTIDFAIALIEHARFNNALRMLGTNWQPTLIMGHDADEKVYALHKAFNQAIGKICVQEIKARQEDDFDPEILVSKPAKKTPANKK